MVIRGGIRGNGGQLAQYLLREGGNDHIRLLDVAGRTDASDAYLHQTLQAMSLTAELTRSPKGLFHAQINPAYAEDRRMSEEDWQQAADILAQELGYDSQRRVIVLHTKKNRTHAHVVFERYDLKTGKVIDNKFSRLGQDRARKEMERVFGHQPTPHRNQHQPELKETLTRLWQETETGADFIHRVHDTGYLLAEGVPRHPFMVVDEQGRSFDLVRQLKGVRIKEVRQRLRQAELIPEKEAIELMRQRQESSNTNKGEQPRRSDEARRTASAFWKNKQELTTEGVEAKSQKKGLSLADNATAAMTQNGEDNDSLKVTRSRARAYLLNADALTGKAEEGSAAVNDSRIADDHTQANDDSTTEPQRARSQLSTEGEAQSYQDKLKVFMQSGEELVDQAEPAKEETAQRQQATARQFLETGAAIISDATHDENEIKRLMQEQKAIRERDRQKIKRRLR